MRLVHAPQPLVSCHLKNTHSLRKLTGLLTWDPQSNASSRRSKTDYQKSNWLVALKRKRTAGLATEDVWIQTFWNLEEVAAIYNLFPMMSANLFI